MDLHGSIVSVSPEINIVTVKPEPEAVVWRRRRRIRLSPYPCKDLQLRHCPLDSKYNTVFMRNVHNTTELFIIDHRAWAVRGLSG